MGWVGLTGREPGGCLKGPRELHVRMSSKAREENLYFLGEFFLQSPTLDVKFSNDILRKRINSPWGFGGRGDKSEDMASRSQS